MSYSNNPNSILAGTGITVTPTSGTGANTITISASGTETLAVRIATVSPIVVTNADAVVSVEMAIPGPVAVTLPAGVPGAVFDIKDGLGLAATTDPITITPAAGTIDGAATASINTAYGSVTLVYTGVQWILI